MDKLLWVGAGGFVGSACRFALSGWVQKISGSGFPYGTFAVNVIGCFVITLLAGLAESRQIFTPATRLFVMVGMLGGFTTFSTFGYETFSLLRDGESLKSLAYVGGHLFAAGVAIWLGYSAAIILGK